MGELTEGDVRVLMWIAVFVIFTGGFLSQLGRNLADWMCGRTKRDGEK